MPGWCGLVQRASAWDGPKGIPRKVEKAILAARTMGKGINRIASDLGVGSSTVRRVIEEAKG